jgi:Restriction endonuclease
MPSRTGRGAARPPGESLALAPLRLAVRPPTVRWTFGGLAPDLGVAANDSHPRSNIDLEARRGGRLGPYRDPMHSMAVQDMQLLVVADESSKGGRGGLFERFIAKLLASEYGFMSPSTQSLNVTSEGIELDVVAKHKLTGSSAVAECKAYTRPVSASELTNFYGRLAVERFEEPQAFGLLCALPRLTAEGQEKANAIAARDQNFRYLSANDLAGALRQAALVADPPSSVGEASDHAILVTERGIFGACIALHATSRTPTHVALWAASGPVPADITELVGGTEYANRLPVRAFGSDEPQTTVCQEQTPDPVLLTSVAGSSSDFEYQLPASPKYFVGRAVAVRRLDTVIATDHGTVVVLNAQSGWGKSSLALKMGDLVARRQGIASVLDTRTANAQR